MSIILDGTSGITTPGVTGITTPVSVGQGGTGRASTTAYAVICGGTTSTSAEQSIASVGTSGQVLTSNGAGALPTFQTISTSASPQYALYTSGTSTWTCPAGVTKIKVTVIGGGGGGAFWSSISSYGGGTGGAGFNYYTVTPGTGYTVTVGAGGNGGSSSGSNGGTSSFSSLISATGGAGTVTFQVPGADGTCANGLLNQGAMAANGYGFLGAITSVYGSNTAQTWTAALGYAPGAKGLRYNACQGSGGVGGAVYIEYIG